MPRSDRPDAKRWRLLAAQSIKDAIERTRRPVTSLSLSGVSNVRSLREKGDVNGLLAVLCDEHEEKWYARAAATEALAEMGAIAVGPLIDALSNKEARRWVAFALGGAGDARAVEPLIAVLNDEDWYVREAAAGALGKLGDARAVAPLMSVLKDKRSYVRQAAANALGAIGDVQAVGALAAVLKDDVWSVREAAAYALARIGAPAVEALIGALEDRRPDIRRPNVQKIAAEALERIGGPEAERALAEYRARRL